MVTEQNEWRTQNTKSTVENQKKTNYLTTLCTNLSSTTCRMDLADILSTYKSSICNFTIQFCKSWRPKTESRDVSDRLTPQQFLLNVIRPYVNLTANCLNPTYAVFPILFWKLISAPLSTSLDITLKQISIIIYQLINNRILTEIFLYTHTHSCSRN